MLQQAANDGIYAVWRSEAFAGGFEHVIIPHTHTHTGAAGSRCGSLLEVLLPASVLQQDQWTSSSLEKHTFGALAAGRCWDRAAGAQAPPGGWSPHLELRALTERMFFIDFLRAASFLLLLLFVFQRFIITVESEVGGPLCVLGCVCVCVLYFRV